MFNVKLSQHFAYGNRVNKKPFFKTKSQYIWLSTELNNQTKTAKLENSIRKETIPAQLANISMHYDESINNAKCVI
jgi:hypothetical protein